MGCVAPGGEKNVTLQKPVLNEKLRVAQAVTIASAIMEPKLLLNVLHLPCNTYKFSCPIRHTIFIAT